MPERQNGCCLWYFFCSLMLGLLAIFLFFLGIIFLMNITAAIPHKLPLQQSIEHVTAVELVYISDWELPPEQVTLTESHMTDFLPKLAELKSYGGLGDPIPELGRYQVKLTYENGDQDILSDWACRQITDGNEDPIYRGLDQDVFCPMMLEYFPAMTWRPSNRLEIGDMFKGILRITAIILCLLLLWGPISAVAIVRYAKVDERYWADCIIVLGAGTDGKEPNPVFRERLNHAITLYEGGYSRHIILTGGLFEGNTLTDSQIAANYLTSNGIPADVILLETKSTITQENLSGARDIMYAEGMTTALIVSDPLHMKRAVLMARDCCIQPYSAPTPTTRYQTWKTKIPFLLRETFFYVGYRIHRNFVKV